MMVHNHDVALDEVGHVGEEDVVDELLVLPHLLEVVSIHEVHLAIAPRRHHGHNDG